MAEKKARIYGYAILIDKFEPELRSFIANGILRMGYGRKWLDGVPTGIIDIVYDRGDRDNFDDPLEFLDYTDFIHLKEIIIYLDNFNYSDTFFGDVSKNKFIELMDELYSFRNKIAHAKRNFSLLDLSLIHI